MNKKRRNTILLILVLIVLALGVMYLQRVVLQEHGTFAVIAMDGKEVRRLNLNTDTEFKVELSTGGYNQIVVKNGKVSVTESDCDNQICVMEGEISESYEMIVCLPHGLTITIETK